MKKMLTKIWSDEHGQAAVEYAIIAMGLLIFFAVFDDVANDNGVKQFLFRFYQDLACLICLPIP